MLIFHRTDSILCTNFMESGCVGSYPTESALPPTFREILDLPVFRCFNSWTHWSVFPAWQFISHPQFIGLPQRECPLWSKAYQDTYQFLLRKCGSSNRGGGGGIDNQQSTVDQGWIDNQQLTVDQGRINDTHCWSPPDQQLTVLIVDRLTFDSRRFFVWESPCRFRSTYIVFYIFGQNWRNNFLEMNYCLLCKNESRARCYCFILQYVCQSILLCTL